MSQLNLGRGPARAQPILRGSALYPAELNDLSNPPDQLYAIGEWSVLDRPRIAIVGTRNASAYGIRIARAIAGGLSGSGVCIISGMARGIDAESHRSSMERAGRTVAVLGTGIDVPYPVGHRSLHRAISLEGLVLSEHGPGTRAHTGAFPRRNRIIAALAPVVIVVEAGHRSGALNTARQALELGRTVAAVPGPIDAPTSAGANELIRDGAVAIVALADAFALAGVSPSMNRNHVHLGVNEARVWDALAGGPLDTDSIAFRSELSARDCLGAVTALELAGMVECLLSGEVRRT